MQNAYFIVGPTGIGKSSVAHAIAEATGRPLLSTDAMSIYQDMDIGTDKPDRATIERFNYYGVNLARPDERFSVGKYLDRVRDEFRARPVETEPIAVGGTGLYVKCLTRGLEDLPKADPEVRKNVEQLHREQGVEALQAALREAAPDLLESLADPENPRRLVRALEWARAGVTPDRAWLSSPETTLIGLKMDRELLYTRIVTRVHRMFSSGIIEEVEFLEKTYEQLSDTSRQAIGYQEAFQVLHGTSSVDEAIERTIIRTRQLAKRQMTWFRNQSRIHWIDMLPDASLEEVCRDVQNQWRHYGPAPIHI